MYQEIEQKGRDFKQNLVRGLARRALPLMVATTTLFGGAVESHATPLQSEPTPPSSTGCLKDGKISYGCYLSEYSRIYRDDDKETYEFTYGNPALIFGIGSLEATGFSVRPGETLSLTDYLRDYRRVYPDNCGQSAGVERLSCMYGIGSLEAEGLIPPQ